MLRLEIAVFCWIGGKENFMLRARQRLTEGLILLGISQVARQAVPKTKNQKPKTKNDTRPDHR